MDSNTVNQWEMIRLGVQGAEGLESMWLGNEDFLDREAAYTEGKEWPPHKRTRWKEGWLKKIEGKLEADENLVENDKIILVMKGLFFECQDLLNNLMLPWKLPLNIFSVYIWHLLLN